MFDFSTLYKNIPHHKLKSMTGELINLCFNGGVKGFIGSLSMVLFGLMIKQNLDCLLMKHL